MWQLRLYILELLRFFSQRATCLYSLLSFCKLLYSWERVNSIYRLNREWSLFLNGSPLTLQNGLAVFLLYLIELCSLGLSHCQSSCICRERTAVAYVSHYVSVYWTLLIRWLSGIVLPWSHGSPKVANTFISRPRTTIYIVIELRLWNCALKSFAPLFPALLAYQLRFCIDSVHVSQGIWIISNSPCLVDLGGCSCRYILLLNITCLSPTSTLSSKGYSF